ncbi:MAG: 50S ribosomal protein L11 methyltransferase, partial [Chitinophagales bacterium]|nr:50S ribosomal protein L11 methyltransferase [Chitinophagales bacterium]
MQNFTVVQFEHTQGNNDVLVALLTEILFDSFEEPNENSLNAYILETDFDEEKLKDVLLSMPFLNETVYKIEKLETKNWNEEWEKNFKPILIEDKCAVRAPFHQAFNTEFEIVIEPKMAFGTGHHATTEMMLALMLTMDFNDKEVLDFG